MLEFIDVSHHQGQIDWKKAASVIDGAVIRCGLRGYGSAGKLQADSCWERNIKGAIAAGVPRIGSYFFGQAVIADEGKEEAEYALKLLLTCVLRGHSEAMAHELAPAYALQYIHAHYTEHITLDQLAALEHISKSYLSRQFRQRTGMTVIAYVNRLRIEAAKRLLTASDKGVNESAYQVGFESPKYFYRTFRNLTGVSPAAFRRQYSRTS